MSSQNFNNGITEQVNIILQLIHENKIALANQKLHELINQNISEENDLFDLASLAVKLNDNDTAIKTYKKLTEASTSHRLYLAYHALGNCYKESNDLPKAIESYKQAISHNNEFQSAYIRLGNAYRGMGDNKTAINYYQQGLKIKRNTGLHTRILLAMHYDGEYSAETLFKEHKKWGENFDLNKYQYENPFKQKGKIILGFVSADFRLHSISYFLLPLLENINNNKFTVVLFSNTQNEDKTTTQFKQLVDNYISIVKKNDAEVVGLIKNQKIDVLIDLSGHTPGNRLKVFSKKPAPLQISYLGYPNTTGLEAIDYRIVDSITDPLGIGEQLNTEKLLRAQHSFLCFNSLDKENIHPDKDIPFIKNQYITFGSFNDISKLNNQVIKTWATILLKMPNSKLLLKTKGLATTDNQVRYLEKFRQFGLNEKERIVFVGRIASRQAHLKYYNNIDIALDTFPYNGTTTTLQALSMGVPVITLIGFTHHSRVGYSILHHAGIVELAAIDREEYINKAVALASDTKQIVGYKHSLRTHLNNTISNEKEFVTDFESLIESSWNTKLSKDNVIKNEENNQSPDTVMTCVGDVILARRMHQVYPLLPAKDILNSTLEIFEKSDINLLNLETVISETGNMMAKGERNPYYFRANKNLANLLLEMNTHIVISANNHAMDFGPDALKEQNNWLQEQQILSVGSGNNLEQAKEPKYIRHKNTVVGVISFCTVKPFGLAATNEGGGIFQIKAIKDISNQLKPIIEKAKNQAHLVIISPHWIENWETVPSEALKNQARKLIDLGADAILGHSSHLLHPLEIYNNKPIIYDMGTFLVDTIAGNTELKYSAIFQLNISNNIITSLCIVPVALKAKALEVANNTDRDIIYNKIIPKTLEINSIRYDNYLLIVLGDINKNLPTTPFNKALEATKKKVLNKKNITVEQTQLNNVFFTLLTITKVDAFRVGCGFKIEIDFCLNKSVLNIFEIEITGISTKNKSFKERHPISNGIYDNTIISENTHISDNYFVRVNRNVTPGKYKLYFSVVCHNSGITLNNTFGEDKSYLGEVYVLSEGIPNKAAGIDWSGKLDQKIKATFELEYYQKPEFCLLNILQKLLEKDDNDITNYYSVYGLEEKYGYNKEFSLSYISLYNAKLSPSIVRWGSIRKNMKGAILRNIERIKLHSAFKQVVLNQCLIIFEFINKQTKYEKTKYTDNQDEVNISIKICLGNQSHVLPFSECLQNNLITINEKIKYLLVKNQLTDQMSELEIWLVEFIIFAKKNDCFIDCNELIAEGFKE